MTPVIFILFTIIPLLIVIRSSVIVPQHSAYIVERLGRYFETKKAGFHIIIPVIDVVRFKFSLAEQSIKVNSDSIQTNDGAVCKISGDLWFHILEPERAAYGVLDIFDALKQLTITSIQKEFSQKSLTEVKRDDPYFCKGIASSVNQNAEVWGVRVVRFDLNEIVQVGDNRWSRG